MDPDTTIDADGRAQTIALCAQAIDMLRHARQAFTGHRLDSIDAAERLGRRLHEHEHSLAERLVHHHPATTLVLDADRQRLFVPVHLERIADHIELLLQSLRTVVGDGVPFTDRARREVEELLATTTELLIDLRDLLITHNKTLRAHVIASGMALIARADDFAAFHERRLIEGVCAPRASSLYLAVVDTLKGIEWQTREIAQKLGRVTPADTRDIVAAVEVPVASARGGDRAAETTRLRPSPVGWVP